MGIETQDGSSIVGRTAHFSMGDIHALPDAGEAVAVASGSWSLKFEMNYADTTIDLPAGQSTTWQGSGVTIDAVSVSAIGIAVDYTIDRQTGDLGPSGKMGNEGLAEENAAIGLPIVVTFADGTTFDVTNASSATTKQDDGTSAVVKTATYDRMAKRRRHSERDHRRRGDTRQRRIAPHATGARASPPARSRSPAARHPQRPFPP